MLYNETFSSLIAFLSFEAFAYWVLNGPQAKFLDSCPIRGTPSMNNCNVSEPRLEQFTACENLEPRIKSFIFH